MEAVTLAVVIMACFYLVLAMNWMLFRLSTFSFPQEHARDSTSVPEIEPALDRATETLRFVPTGSIVPE